MKNWHIVLFCSLFFIASCNNNPLDVQLKAKESPIHYINVDQYFCTKSLDTVKTNLVQLHQEYGSLLMYELSQNIRRRITDTSYKAVYQFYQSEYIQALEKVKDSMYQFLPEHEHKIDNAFQYLAYHFGDTVLPQNILFMNKLFSGITCGDTNISVGLESYINPNNPIIKQIPGNQLYQWQRDRMNMRYLEHDILFSWIRAKLFTNINAKLAEHIVQAGKVLYTLNACFPDSSEAFIMRYNQKAYKWAVQNEGDVWNYLVKKQLLFKNQLKVNTNFINKGPTTEGLPEGAPDRMGQFIGYRMVKNYMNQNKNVTLQQLLKTTYNTILQSYTIE